MLTKSTEKAGAAKKKRGRAVARSGGREAAPKAPPQLTCAPRAPHVERQPGEARLSPALPHRAAGGGAAAGRLRDEASGSGKWAGVGGAGGPVLCACADRCDLPPPGPRPRRSVHSAVPPRPGAASTPASGGGVPSNGAWPHRGRRAKAAERDGAQDAIALAILTSRRSFARRSFVRLPSAGRAALAAAPPGSRQARASARPPSRAVRAVARLALPRYVRKGRCGRGDAE